MVDLPRVRGPSLFNLPSASSFSSIYLPPLFHHPTLTHHPPTAKNAGAAKASKSAASNPPAGSSATGSTSTFAHLPRHFHFPLPSSFPVPLIRPMLTPFVFPHSRDFNDEGPAGPTAFWKTHDGIEKRKQARPGTTGWGDMLGMHALHVPMY